jgi:hypothetical protein
MIIDKKKGTVISDNKPSVSQDPVDDGKGKIPKLLTYNAVMDILEAIKQILRKVTWEYGVENSPLVFKTVQRDTGQYKRIVTKNHNNEYTVGFPAAFYHLINWRYLTSAKRINEGRAELRIKFILNRLNPNDDFHDMDVEYVAERIHETIQEEIPNYPCLQERCQLEYIDPMESFDYGLQPCWMTYEIWFKANNAWYERNRIEKYVVMPPFTNHSDQDPTIEGINPDGHTNADHPVQWEERTGYKPSVDDISVDDDEG